MKDYIEQAMRTESCDLNKVAERMVQSRTMRLQHAAMGLVTEAGEFTDALKKHIWYGKPQDETNLKEEIGDLLWYLAIACDALSTDFETEMERNINKLRARYPEKFCDVKAIDRDLDAERAILESKVTRDHSLHGDTDGCGGIHTGVYGTPVIVDDTNGMEIKQPELVSVDPVTDIDMQMTYIINGVNLKYKTSKQRRFTALLEKCMEVFSSVLVDTIDVFDNGREISQVVFKTESGQDVENVKGLKYVTHFVSGA